MLYIYSHYDGPWYIVPAKTFYDPAEIKDLKLESTLPEKYFAAHLPLYPVLIRAVREIGVFRELTYLKSMLSVNLLVTIGLAIFFYYFLARFKLTKNPLFLVSIFLFLPRFLVVRSVGAPESLFILLILLSLYFFEKGKFWWSGLFGGLAVMTKTPGLLLFAAYGLVFFERVLLSLRAKRSNLKNEITSSPPAPRNDIFSWHWLGILLIPLGLLGVFGLFGKQYGDFLAYFHSGDNIHLVSPFSVFNFQKPWVGTAWLEDVFFYFFLYALTVVSLKQSKQRSLFYFSLVFFAVLIFVQHRDIARYSLPLWPMAIIAQEKFFNSKKFLIVFLILLPAIYFYAWNFSIYNIMPIADWRPFL